MEIFTWKKQSEELYKDGSGYLKILERHLVRSSRFDNNLLFNMSIMAFEKLFAALLAHYETEAIHHTPVAMYREANEYDEGLTTEMMDTARLVQSFESICSFDSKGYTTPTDEELRQIIIGLMSIRDYIASVLKIY